MVIPEAAPTPAIAYAVRELKTRGSINFTASHNPPEYNGIKYSTPDGAPALPEVTKQIESEYDGAAMTEPSRGYAETKFEQVDVKPDYLKRMAELVDLKAKAKSGHQGGVRSVLGCGARVQLPHTARAWRDGLDGARLSRCIVRRPCAGAGR